MKVSKNADVNRPESRDSELLSLRAREKPRIHIFKKFQG